MGIKKTYQGQEVTMYEKLIWRKVDHKTAYLKMYFDVEEIGLVETIEKLKAIVDELTRELDS